MEQFDKLDLETLCTFYLENNCFYFLCPKFLCLKSHRLQNLCLSPQYSLDKIHCCFEFMYVNPGLSTKLARVSLESLNLNLFFYGLSFQTLRNVHMLIRAIEPRLNFGQGIVEQ